MRKYEVVIKNNGGFEIYKKTFEETDENNTLEKVLKDVYIASGDIITIEEL